MKELTVKSRILSSASLLFVITPVCTAVAYFSLNYLYSILDYPDIIFFYIIMPGIGIILSYLLCCVILLFYKPVFHGKRTSIPFQDVIEKSFYAVIAIVFIGQTIFDFYFINKLHTKGYIRCQGMDEPNSFSLKYIKPPETCHRKKNKQEICINHLNIILFLIKKAKRRAIWQSACRA